MRQRITSGAVWEKEYGYSRAVRAGNCIEVSGTVAADGNEIIGAGDIKAQTVFIFQKIEKALGELGAQMKDVVRTRMFVTDIRNADVVGKIHGEFFKDIRPATSMIEVKGLIDPKFLIEIEATAILN